MKERTIKKYGIKKEISVVKTIVWVVLLLICISYIALFVWAFLCSLKGKVEFIRDKISLPSEWKFSNYTRVLKELSANGYGVPTMIFNGLWYSVGSITISMLCSTMFAYVMARFWFPGRKFFNVLNIVIMMVPIMGTLPSLMKVVLSLHIYDSPLYLLTSIGGFGGGLVIYRTAFRAVSWEYAEAAYIDGCGHFKVWWKIMMPQVLPLVLAQMIGGFIGVWNDYMTPILMLPSYQNLASGLYTYQISTQRSLDYPLLFAGCLLCAIPTFALFSAGQKWMMSISLAGGLKG